MKNTPKNAATSDGRMTSEVTGLPQVGHDRVERHNERMGGHHHRAGHREQRAGDRGSEAGEGETRPACTARRMMTMTI